MFARPAVRAAIPAPSRSPTAELSRPAARALAAGSSITTQGVGAHALVAQSVGGGGGIAIGGNATGQPTLSTSSAPGAGAQANGGTVSVATNGTIHTYGAGAHGVLAQSVGTGGGLIASGATLFAGSPSASSSTQPAFVGGGDVTITQSGSIQTDGANSIGIFAQVTTNGFTFGQTAITVNGAVRGGSGTQGTGIWVDGGQSNTITIGPAGSVSALSGTAVTYTAPLYCFNGAGCSYYVDVINNGTVTGSYSLGGGTFTNNGTYNSGQTAVAASLVNHGTVFVGGPRTIGHTTITGNLTQTATGKIVVDADFHRRQADLLTVQGNATLDGKIKPVLTGGVRPGIALPVLTVEGSVSGTLQADSSALFGFDVNRSGKQFLLSASAANFAPTSFGLKPSRAAVADHLQSIWDRGSAPAYDSLFGLLGVTADASPSAYSNQLRQLSPDATIAPGARGNARAQSFATSALSCPIFEGTTAMLIEGQCTWLRVTESRADQSPGNGVSDFKIDSTTTQIGAQFQLAPGWFVGGSVAYAQDKLSSSDGLASGDGDSGYGALTLKRETGPWLFAASAFGGAGNVDTRRTINLPGFQAVATGNPDTSSYGLLLRAAYTIGREAFYLRPSLSLSGIRVRTGAYQESGAGALNLAVDAASQTTWAATPMLELGGRVPVGGDMVLRPYVSAGVSFLSNDEWRQTARLVGAPAGTDSFTTTVPIDPVVARIGAGVQLYTGKAFDLRLQYDGEFSKTVTAHGGSLIASLRF